MQITRDHLAGIRALDARRKYIAGQIATLVTASGTGLTWLYGIGPVIAGRILAEVGDVTRFATKDKFASYDGTAPIDTSSGEQVRYRLSRAGNRQHAHAVARASGDLAGCSSGVQPERQGGMPQVVMCSSRPLNVESEQFSDHE